MTELRPADGIRILVGDVREQLAALPPESVHCVVTSPPYWGLRDYGAPGQIGLEPTPDEYVESLVAVFREVRRVLRPDGTVWLNLGDSYAAGKSGRADTGPADLARRAAAYGTGTGEATGPREWSERKPPPGLKQKDLVGIPWRVAFALQADGWWLRSDIVWSKLNPMPESVTDRPTKAHEYLFLLAKGERYFFDQEAVRERYVYGDDGRLAFTGQAEANERRGLSAAGPDGRRKTHVQGGDGSAQHRDGERWPNPAGRNIRSVWTIATEPYPEAHFATFPTALVEPCVKAGASERGCCPECGAPWERVVERRELSTRERVRNVGGRTDGLTRGGGPGEGFYSDTETTGWRPTCGHWEAVGGEGIRREPCAPVPCVVLDPFVGSGTTPVTARRLGRHAIGIELNPDYAALAEKRCAQWWKTPARARRDADPGQLALEAA